MTVMKRDYSGKNFSRKMNKGLLVTNIIVFFLAAAVLGGSLYYEEEVSVVAMLLVMIVSAGNAIMSFLRLKGKRL